MAQDAAVNELVITGTVKNKDSRKKLENVNVSVVGNNIGTVTNADGTFSLKVAEAEAFPGLEVSHIGYLTTHLSLEELENGRADHLDDTGPQSFERDCGLWQ